MDPKQPFAAFRKFFTKLPRQRVGDPKPPVHLALAPPDMIGHRADLEYLRDRFAIAALTGAAVQAYLDPKTAVRRAYALADAAIAFRSGEVYQ